MTFYILAYLAGLFTIATPCILPVLPFVLARADVPFRRGGLPMLVGLAVAFAAVASLAAFAGGWAVAVNHQARTVILAMLALFGLTMFLPPLATRLLTPVSSIGDRLAQWASGRASDRGAGLGTSLLLGIATGLIWAPCAGPVLGLILSGAALRGPSLETSLLLLAYGLGAATSLGIGIVFGRRLLSLVRWSARWDDVFRRVVGAGVVASAATIWLGADTGLLTRLSSTTTTRLEQTLIETFRHTGAIELSTTAQAATPALTGPLASLLEASPWVNATPLRAEDLRGKVVVLNFWTYSCINCLRTLPHVRAWAEKYKDQGLVVIGVHTPEFAFEKDAANVRKAVASLGVGYPVVLDNDFGIWRTFGNEAWPALYFIGTDGRIRDQKFGEGDYEESERLIQQLLSEAKGATVTKDITPVTGQGAQAAPDLQDMYSGETYLGYDKATNFASPGGADGDAASRYAHASTLPLNYWSLAGLWTIGGEFATLTEAGGSIAYRFHARDLHLVMGPSDPDRPVRFRVTIDGAAPGASHGADVDADGWGILRQTRLYQLVRQAGSVGEHTFKIEFHDPGVRAYSFTFG